MYGAFHPDAQKGAENDTLLTNKAKSGSNSRILVAVGALCAFSGAAVGAYALSGSNAGGFSGIMRLGASETCGTEHCLTLLQGDSEQLSTIFDESFSTVCSQANQVVETGSTLGLKEKKHALCSVPKCFDILNAELGKVSKDEAKQQSMKNVVITQFYDLCYPTSTAAMGRKETKKATPAVHAAPKRSRLGSKCNVDSCLSLLSSDDDKINDIFGESFDTVCVKSREYQSNPNAELGEVENAVCDVAQCFDMLNIALPNEDNKLKDIVINEFQELCYGGASLGKKESKKHVSEPVSKVGFRECNVDACLTMLQGESEDLNRVFGESFTTVCTQSREFQTSGSLGEGEKENTSAVCSVPKCFETLNVALSDDNNLKDIVINEFQAICFPESA
tara:strand:+ start:184 stop:1356 length:1173 start_codon:yes stop_codon:yes gene_type:complete